MANLTRDENGRLPAFAWPGGYPIQYVCSDGATLCAACATDEDATDLSGCDVYWEGPVMYCDNCNAEMESAYGDPDADDEDHCCGDECRSNGCKVTA